MSTSPELKSKAARWLEVSHDYWTAMAAEFGSSAVVWCDGETEAVHHAIKREYRRSAERIRKLEKAIGDWSRGLGALTRIAGDL